MMNIRAVIRDNEFSDGWRPVIQSHFYVKQVVRQLQEPWVSMATELDASFTSKMNSHSRYCNMHVMSINYA